MSTDLDAIVEKILPDVAFMTLDQPNTDMTKAVRAGVVSQYGEGVVSEDTVGRVAQFFDMMPTGRKLVKDARKNLVEESGMMEFLPDEVEVARNLYTIGTTAPDMKDRVAAMKEYSELLRFKDPDRNNDRGAPVHHVMKVYVSGDGSKDDWEARATHQQEEVQREAAEHEARTRA